MTASQQFAATASEAEQRQQFVSDVFHALSQPLTALRCSLELALMQEGDAQRYRTALAEALRHAERLVRCAEFLRVMAEAEDPGNPCATDLRECVAAAVEEFTPIFEFSGRSVSVQSESPLVIMADPAKVQRGFFLALDYGAASERDVRITVRKPANAEIDYKTEGQRKLEAPSAKAGQSLELSQRIFRATGAEVTLQDGESVRLKVNWPEVRE